MRNPNSLLAVLALSFSSIAAIGCATTGTDDGTSDTADESAGAGKVDLWQSTDGWHFHLKSGNGAILLASESYTDRTGAINGILSLMNNGADPGRYQVTQTATGYVVHLVAGNNEIVSFSQVYATKASATRAVTSCVRAATSYLDKREAISTGARVAVDASATGGYHFNVFAKNGQIVLTSEHYTTEAAAYNGAFAVQASTTWTVLANGSTGFYFTVTASNGQVVGISQQYSTQQAAQIGATAAQALIASIAIL